MRAIIWKEIRENLKWAVLAMLALAVVIAYNLYLMSRPYNWDMDRTIVSGSLLIAMFIGAVLAGGALGLLQTLPERRRDQWAFLLHRPVQPTWLFLGKAIAGLTLYGAATLLPLLAAALWMATPGHVAAPFQWKMLLPGIARILAGVSFYFAGMISGVRDARWYGSRALPFALAVICAIFVAQIWEFWQAAVGAALFAAVLAVAAWGSFVVSGQYGPQPLIAKGSLALVLFAGVLGVGLVGAVCLGSLLEEPAVERTRYGVTKDGDIVRLNLSSYGQSVRSITDLAGNPIDAPKDAGLYDLTHSMLLRFDSIRDNPEYYPIRNYASIQRFAIPLDTEGAVTWYYVPAERLIVGYDRETRRRDGSIGPGGFVPAGTAPTELFPAGRVTNEWYYDNVLAFPSGVYQIDLRARRAKLLDLSARQEPVVGAGLIRTNAGWPPVGLTGVLTTKHIELFSETSRLLVSFASDYPVEEYPGVGAAVTPKGDYVIWYQPSTIYFAPSERYEHIVMVSADGEKLARHDLPSILPQNTIRSWPNVLWALLVPIAGSILLFAGMFVFAKILAGYPAVAAALRDARLELFGEHRAFWAAACVVLVAGAVFWALAVYWLARRYELTRRQTFWWTLAGFWFGPSGLLTLLSLRDWPARVKCAACGRMRTVDRPDCSHCGQPFLPPPPAETDIFDDLAHLDKIPVRG